MDGVSVRPLTMSDVDPCREFLGWSFRNNPIMQAVIRHDEAANARLLADFGKTLIPTYLAHGRTYGAVVDEQVRAAMLVLPPGGYPLPFWPDSRLALRALRAGGFGVLRRFAQADAFVRRHHLKAPHYYVYMLGTNESFQGKGLGGRLLDALAEEAGDTPCYLETDDPKNVPFYEKRGFSVVREEDVLIQGTPVRIWFFCTKPSAAKTS